MGISLKYKGKKEAPVTLTCDYAYGLKFPDKKTFVTVDSEVAKLLLRDNPKMFDVAECKSSVAYVEPKAPSNVSDTVSAEKKPTQEVYDVDDADSDTDELAGLSRAQIKDKIFEEYQETVSISNRSLADMRGIYYGFKEA